MMSTTAAQECDLLTDSCQLAFDLVCDDGSPGSVTSACSPNSDCFDCDPFQAFRFFGCGRCIANGGNYCEMADGSPVCSDPAIAALVPSACSFGGGTHFMSLCPCVQSDTPYDAGFGGCPTYAEGLDNHEFCASDVDSNGVLAAEACTECGSCELVSSPSPAPSPSPNGGTPVPISSNRGSPVPTSPNNGDGGGLSAGAGAGIAVGSVVILVAAAGAAWVAKSRCGAKPNAAKEEDEYHRTGRNTEDEDTRAGTTSSPNPGYRRPASDPPTRPPPTVPAAPTRVRPENGPRFKDQAQSRCHPTRYTSAARPTVNNNDASLPPLVEAVVITDDSPDRTDEVERLDP